jgi:hypothetical protein
MYTFCFFTYVFILLIMGLYTTTDKVYTAALKAAQLQYLYLAQFSNLWEQFVAYASLNYYELLVILMPLFYIDHMGLYNVIQGKCKCCSKFGLHEKCGTISLSWNVLCDWPIFSLYDNFLCFQHLFYIVYYWLMCYNSKKHVAALIIVPQVKVEMVEHFVFYESTLWSFFYLLWKCSVFQVSVLYCSLGTYML